MKTAIDILSAHEMRNTVPRVQILQALLQHASALSQSDIERTLGGSCDRATIYRTLASLTEKGVLHRIYDNQNTVRYALCQTGCVKDTHSHNHVHFKCANCGQTRCLEHTHVSLGSLPNGYTVNETNFLLVGVCATCNA